MFSIYGKLWDRGWYWCRCPDLIKVFRAGSASKLLSYLQQTCENDASGPTYRPERLGCWIRAMNCRCWKMLDRFMCWEQVKVMREGVLWLPYLSFYWFYLHQSVMDGSSCNIYAFNRLWCWVWDIGFGCWMKLRFRN